MAINKHHRNNNQSGKTSCADLPHDCVVNIFSFLTLMERCQSSIMLVCKSWLHATKDRALYTVCDLEPRTFLKEELARWWVPAESVQCWTPEYESKMDNMLRAAVALSNGNLKEIRVRHCSDRSLLLVAERCPNVEVLSIKVCPNVTDVSMVKVASGCPKLKEVDISYCYKISHTSLQMLGRKCTNLSVLKRNHIGIESLLEFESEEYIDNVPITYLNSGPQDQIDSSLAFIKCMPELYHLELRFARISAPCLAGIAKGCTKLRYLDISGNSDISDWQIKKATSNLSNFNVVNRKYYSFPRDRATERAQWAPIYSSVV